MNDHSSNAGAGFSTSSDHFDPVSSLWKLLLVLGIAGLIASLSLNFYLLKQNRMLMFQRRQQTEQLARLDQTRAALQALLQDVASFSIQYPEVRGILAKYGISVNAAPPPQSSAHPLPMPHPLEDRPVAPLPPSHR